MTNNNKNILRMGLSLLLALIMVMPMEAFAEKYSSSVENWKGYRDEVEKAILDQKREITINFNSSQNFVTENSARNKIKVQFKEVIEKLPKHLKKLNILNTDDIDKIQTAVELKGTSNTPLKSITHKIEYISPRKDIQDLQKLFKEKNDKDIKFKATDYEKIKAAYDYIIKELEKPEGPIKIVSESHKKNGRAFLFAMMMTELGYENDIATNDDSSHKWNLVKVQGKWYHVDIKNGKLLVSKEYGTWNNDEHDDKKDDFASKDYDINNFEELQLEYEVILLGKEVEKILTEIPEILEDISIEQVIQNKEKLKGIEENIKEYKVVIKDLSKRLENIKESWKGKIETLIEGLNVDTEEVSERIELIETLNSAIESVENLEKTMLEKDISLAYKLVSSIDDDFEVKNILKSRIYTVQAEIQANKDEQELIVTSINNLEDKIKGVPVDNSLSEIIKEIETAFETAESEVNKIKDTDIKANQQARINEIKLAIAAIKAVGNAEITPLKTTNVTSARKAIEELSEEYWKISGEDTIIEKLNDRLEVVEKMIAASGFEVAAIKAVEKAEKSMKVTDIVLANDAIESFKNSGANPDVTQLNNRIAVIVAINNMENSLADYLIEHSLGNRTRLDPAIGNAAAAITSIEELDIDDIVEKYAIRLEVARNTRRAIDKIMLAVETAGSEEAPGPEKEEAIKAAEEAIAMILDSKIRKELENKLINIASQEGAKNQIDKAKSSIASVDDIANDEGLLGDIIKETEEAVKIAESEIKKIKDKDAKIPYQDDIKEIKLAIAAMKGLDKAETPPFKATNVTSASKAIEKLSEDYWEISGEDTIIKKLNVRLARIEKELSELGLKANAIKAVEKAEKSMKEIDIASANDAIESIGGKVGPDTIVGLESRIAAIVAMNDLENSLMNCLGKNTEKNSNRLGNAITDANTKIGELGIVSLQIKYTSRLVVVQKSKDAMKKIRDAKDAIATEEIEGKEEVIIEAIDAAKNSIAQVSDSKIKKELEKELDDIITQRDIEDKIAVVEAAIDIAKDSVKYDMDLYKNTDLVKIANDEVKKLPNISQKKGFQDTIKELNNAIKAKQIVKDAEDKLENGKLIAKDVSAAEKVVSDLNKEYKEPEPESGQEDIKNLNTRVQNLRTGLELLEAGIAKNAVEVAEKSAVYDNKSVSKDITGAKKAVDIVSNKSEYGKINLNTRIRALESYVSTIKVLEKAEKTISEANVNATKAELAKFKAIVGEIVEGDKGIYTELVGKIEDRIAKINEYLSDESAKVNVAEEKVENIETLMTKDSDPSSAEMREAQILVDMVTDKTIKVGLQKRIDAVQIAKDAKIAVTRAEAYPTEKSVKDAETALNKVDGIYAEIIEDLGGRIANLRNQLDIAKKVAEATKLVQKAMETRNGTDVEAAQFDVDALKDLAPATYESLKQILFDLRESIKDEAGDQDKALEDANTALHGKEDGEIGLFARLDEISTGIINIIAGQEGEAGSIQDVYVLIGKAKNQIIIADAAVRRLKDKGDMLGQVNGAKEELYVLEDNLHVREAFRLTTLASDAVNKGKDEESKSKARLAISAAKRVIARISHDTNRAEKTIILDTINAIEAKLTSDNDQELIDIAIEAVNDAADLLTKAVREDQVIEIQDQIDKAIFSAKMAIGWISDNNKAAKDTLTGFLSDIESMYKAEKDGILNEERIKNAEEAVKKAEGKKGSDELESYIRSARLRVKMIRNDGPETELIINDLNARLDILEGKTSGGSGDNPGDKPGGGSSGGASNPNKPSTNSKTSKDGFIGVNQPKWGATKELNKKAPVIKLPRKR